jgi:hypothetical protein
MLQSISDHINKDNSTTNNVVENFDIMILDQWKSAESFIQILEQDKINQQLEQDTHIGELKKQLLDYSKFLTLTPEVFEESTVLWWRKFSVWNYKNFLVSGWKDKDWFNQAIQVMEYYLENYSFREWFWWKMDKWWIEFHLWQQYAMIWDYTSALKWFNKLQKEWSKKHWTEYLETTIAFLNRDKEKVKLLYEQSRCLKIEWDKEFIWYLYRYFDQNYAVAYNWGISLMEQSKYLEKLNK